MTAYQLYSSRNFQPLHDTLAMLAAAGYDCVEGYGAVYPDRAALASLASDLRDAGLAMKTGHFSLDLLEGDPAFVLDAARMLGMERLYCPWLAPEERPTDTAGWRALGARLQAAGQGVRAAGYGFGWHNHDFEFLPGPDGQFPIDALFQGGPDLEWEIDVAWVVRGGADPLHWIARHAARITTVHVKDIAQPGSNADEDGWADLGDGIVPWARILPALRAAGVAHYVIEHDNPSDHARFARRSLAAFEKV